jgi:hypothetical protein
LALLDPYWRTRMYIAEKIAGTIDPDEIAPAETLLRHLAEPLESFSFFGTNPYYELYDVNSETSANHARRNKRASILWALALASGRSAAFQAHLQKEMRKQAAAWSREKEEELQTWVAQNPAFDQWFGGDRPFTLLELSRLIFLGNSRNEVPYRWLPNNMEQILRNANAPKAEKIVYGARLADQQPMVWPAPIAVTAPSGEPSVSGQSYGRPRFSRHGCFHRRRRGLSGSCRKSDANGQTNTEADHG